MKWITKLTRTMRGRLTIVSLLLTIVPIILLGIISYQTAERNLSELGETNLKNTVEYTLQLIEMTHAVVEEGNISLEDAQENVKQIILGEMNPDGTRPINENLDLGENGYIEVYDQDGNSIAHPYDEGENGWDLEDSNGVKFTQEIIETGNSGGGVTYYDWPLPHDESVLEQKVAYSKTDPDWNWIVSANTYVKDFNEPANQILKVILITTLVSIVISVIAIGLFNSRVSNRLRLVTERMRIIAQKDLAEEPLKVTAQDETGILVESVNSLQSVLRNLLENITNSSEVVAGNSEELAQSANEVMNGAEQVAATMEELSSGSETQANSTSDLATAMNSFTGKVSEANEKGEVIDEHSKVALHLTQEGSELMEKSVQQMTKIDQVILDGVQKIEHLDQQANEISELVTVINNIADQTNLLALNAAIEAARAGEHGKGFAVVADEVRKLAEQVSDSVLDVTEIVSGIQKESKVMMESLQSGYKEVSEGTSQIETTGEKLKSIDEAITKVVELTSQITGNLSDITANTQEMNGSIEEIASISEESAAGVEETAASTEQITSSMEEISGSSEQLAKTAEELNELVHEFKL